ncbi:MAG: uroporphyrinogen decarboxylase family protein, partial [Deltaproteobacteria bacterium]|nr:uroporphyrinogen decarboxylase family protein [Deltaproteobacteria bacterium]
DIYLDPNFVYSLFERIIEEVLAPWVLHLKKEFPNAKNISGDDASGSLPIVNPDIIKKWIIPYVQRLRELCGPEIYVPNWVGEKYLKNPEEMLDLKHKVCPDFVEGQDPDVEELGPALYKEYAEKKNIPLLLGIGAAFMALNSPKEVAKRVRKYMEIGGKGGRFALLFCNLGATTPPENVESAIETVHRYGSYR